MAVRVVLADVLVGEVEVVPGVGVAAVGVPRVPGVAVPVELRDVDAGPVQGEVGLLDLPVAAVETAVVHVTHLNPISGRCAKRARRDICLPHFKNNTNKRNNYCQTFL